MSLQQFGNIIHNLFTAKMSGHGSAASTEKGEQTSIGKVGLCSLAGGFKIADKESNLQYLFILFQIVNLLRLSFLT